jgi:hypothetical protein
VLKCVANGGMKDRIDRLMSMHLDNALSSPNSATILDRTISRKESKLIALCRDDLLKFTNSYLLTNINTVLTYGDNQAIDRANAEITPIYATIKKTLGKKMTISYKTYMTIATVMCKFANQVADCIKNTNKANLPAAKNMLAGLFDNFMVPLKAYLGGFIGILIGNGVSADIKGQVRSTYKKIKKMSK